MPHKDSETNRQDIKTTSLEIVWPIVLIGGCLGLILSWYVLSGDSQGRVNLLYLLLVYLLIPLISVTTSIISLFFGKGVNLARVISSLPIGSYLSQAKVRKIQQLKVDKYWFLIQSQVAAIAFSLMSLVAFFLLLIGTDINFVWRSTLLNAADLLPILKIIALPWSFWESAQPSIELLQLTKNSRLSDPLSGILIYGDWWQFILATQLFYCLFIRLVLLILSIWGLNRVIDLDLEQQLQSEINRHPLVINETVILSEIVNEIPKKIVINNWANLPTELLEKLSSLDLTRVNQIKAGPHATRVEQITAERWQTEQLVIVKAWEPPLGELEDFLQNGKGYILPLDWNESGLVKPSLTHINEWRRFANKLPHWQVYLPESLT